MTWRSKGVTFLKLGLILLVLVGYTSVNTNKAIAAQITSRSLTLEAGATDAGSKPSGVVKHLFSFSIPSSGTLGSIQFLYCTTASGSCTPPTGLSTSSGALGTSTGAVFTSAVSTSANSIYITRTAASFAGGAVTEELTSITNPSTTGSFYVRISTFASTDTTGSAIDTGTVAGSTATQITLTGTMPESLIFCTGGTIGTTSGIPDCATATSGSVSFNQLFSPADTATASSQMAASTNASSGYNITYSGATLTSGGNTITPMSSATTGLRGTRQFGLNLMANTTTTSNPAVGSSIAPAANGTNYRGQALAGYNTADTFKFTTSGDSVANSASGGAGPTDAQIYTASYIVNVSGGTPVGTYTTTLTYICTATY